jgi:hypothetical protein
MAELKRRAAAMLEFISRSQKEMADAEVRGLRSPKIAVQKPSPEADVPKSIEPADKPTDVEGKELTNGTAEQQVDQPVAATLADELATRLVKWQQEFTGEAAVMSEA